MFVLSATEKYSIFMIMRPLLETGEFSGLWVKMWRTLYLKTIEKSFYRRDLKAQKTNQFLPNPNQKDVYVDK